MTQEAIEVRGARVNNLKNISFSIPINQLTVVCELMPGIPLLEGIDAHGIKRQIITKAGNFGDAETLVQLFQRA